LRSSVTGDGDAAYEHGLFEVAGRTPATVSVHAWNPDAQETVLYWPALGFHRSGLDAIEVAEVLATEFGAGMLAIDPPGYGASPSVDSYEPRALAALAAGVLAAFDKERAAFVGHSWGGTIGLFAAAASPERFDRLALLDSGYLESSDWMDVGASHEERKARAEEAREELVFADWAQLRDALTPPRGWDRQLEAAIRWTVRESSGRFEPRAEAASYADVLESLVDVELGPSQSQIAAAAVPVLCLVATEPASDEDVRKRSLDRLTSRIARAEVVPVHGAGHDLVREAPLPVAREIGRWLQRLAAG
jgi:pimeloyl-ACP methyl ester carboxylesterase